MKILLQTSNQSEGITTVEGKFLEGKDDDSIAVIIHNLFGNELASTISIHTHTKRVQLEQVSFG